MDRYWEKGYKNEIDIVAVNDRNRIVELYNVKIENNEIDIKALKKRVVKI